MGHAYSSLLYPKAGGDPRLVVVLHEQPEGWLVERISLDSFEAPRPNTFLSSSEWSRKKETEP